MRVEVYQPRLRWDVPHDLPALLTGHVVERIERRGKYILLRLTRGSVLLHLGMSGSLRLVETGTPRLTHDHVDIALSNGLHLRLHDPRRFGALLWCDGDPLQHPRLAKLGPEPLEDAFDAAYLHQRLHTRHSAIKPMLMQADIVVGVGNIYANEALFLSGIDPRTPCSALTLQDAQRLVGHIKQLLQRAIEQGGTTLRDFVNPHGKPGYFQQTLNVYGRRDEPCRVCTTPIAHIVQAQRSTFYCPHCQKNALLSAAPENLSKNSINQG